MIKQQISRPVIYFLVLIAFYCTNFGILKANSNGMEMEKPAPPTLDSLLRKLPKQQKPKTDDAKRDQWLVRFSKTTGKNLGSFFQTWGIPTSEQARASISDLPVWMPENFPPISDIESKSSFLGISKESKEL